MDNSFREGMNMNWRTGFVLFVWLLFGNVVYYIVKSWDTDFWDIDTWQIVAAMATWLLAGGIAFAILQVRQARKNTDAQLAVELFKELRNYETVEKLRSIYDLTSEDLKRLPSDREKEIDYILDRLDVLGALVVNRIIDKKLAIETYGGYSALRCWYKLCASFIRLEQCNRGYYNENYEALQDFL
jgi:hypothetical protein